MAETKRRTSHASHTSGVDPEEKAIDGREPGDLVGRGRMEEPTLQTPLLVWRWPAAVRALRHRDYRLMWSGALVSNIGSWMQTMAQAWLVYELSHSALWLGIDGAAADIPVALLLPLGGALADRLDRRRTLIFTNLFSAVLAAILAVLVATGTVRVWMIVTLSFFTGLTDALRIPANQSMIPAIVPRSDLPNAIALNSMQFNASRIIGPTIGGIALVSLGAAWSFGLNAVSFLGVIIAMVMLHNPPAVRQVKESVLGSLRSGVAYVRSRADLKMMLLLVVIGGVLGGPVNELLPAIVKEVYGGDARAYTMMLCCFGVGAVTGSLIVAAKSAKRLSPWRAFPLLMTLGVAEVFMGWGGHLVLAGVLAAVIGLMFTASFVRLNAAILHSTPDALQGRVSSFQVLAFRAGLPIGALSAGSLAHHIGQNGVSWVLRLCGVCLFASVGTLLFISKRRKIAFQGEEAHVAAV